MTADRTAGADTMQVDEIQLELNKKAHRKSMLMKVLPFLGLVFVFLFFLAGTRGGLVSSSNLSNLIEQCFTITVVAVGISFIFACGSMDISVGAVMAFAELTMGKLMAAANVPLPVILLAGIAVAVGFALVVGMVTTFLRVPAFIGSLCVMNICTGIVASAVAEKDLYIPYQDYSQFNSPLVKGIVLVVIVIAGSVIFNKTRLGRDLKALGGNELAAQQSGVKKTRSILLAFACMGVSIGVAAFFGLTRTGMVTAATGQGLGLNILVAIVLGGFPLTGGAGARLWGAVVGALTITVLTNGLALMGVDSNISLFVKGVLFMVIVGISYERAKGREVQ